MALYYEYFNKNFTNGDQMSTQTMSIQSQPFHLATGSRTSLEAPKKHDELSRIGEVVAANLSTNEPKVAVLKYEIHSLPNKNLKGKIDLLRLHATHETETYRNVLMAIAGLATVCVASMILSRFNKWYLEKLLDDISNHRLVYLNDPYKFVGLDFYKERAFLLWGSYYILAGGFGLSTGYHLFNQLRKLMMSLKNFAQLSYSIELKELSNPNGKPSDLANAIKDSQILDPISYEGFKSEWMQAPRFIKIGRHLFSLDTLLPALFQKPLDHGKIQHPLMNTCLSEDEQKKLIADLSQLFQIDESEITKFWDPYCGKCIIAINHYPVPSGISKEEKIKYRNSFLLAKHCEKKIPEWNTLPLGTLAGINTQFQKQIFALKRLKRFLKALPEKALNTPIQKTDTESFTLQQLLDSTKKELENTFESIAEQH
jgi:hypothetical protein